MLPNIHDIVHCLGCFSFLLCAMSIFLGADSFTFVIFSDFLVGNRYFKGYLIYYKVTKLSN